MKKDKDQKMVKRQALKSFLETSTTPTSSDISPELNRQNNDSVLQYDEQMVQENNNCNVCNADIPKQKLKHCAFCSLASCSDHLRKRRKKKGKWERICDNCQDRVIYDIYMKLQTKAQESLCVQEQITYLKHQTFEKQAIQRRQKRKQIAFKTLSLQQEKQSKMQQFSNIEATLMTLQSKVSAQQLVVRQLQVFVQRVQASFKDNCQEDWSILSQQNSRLAKQLAKLQKRCLQIKMAIQKRQRQIEQAFNAWQQKQFKSKIQNEQRQAAAKKKNDGCNIY